MDDFKIILDLNRFHIETIGKSVIKKLHGFNDENMLLSGDDSGLTSIWEEICAQVQKEYSFFWDAYKTTIRECIKLELEDQHAAVRDLIFYVSNLDFEENEQSPEHVENDIFKVVMELAEYFKNPNIENYLEDCERSDDIEDEEVS
ncbi:MAG: hypothetical protein EOO20_08225 [Chryseobacterium sp.]|nr:MAG: hypothetical protein EOO20_08225 [Chryseobacterium sp.]